jgi:hypothetical protein
MSEGGTILIKKRKNNYNSKMEGSQKPEINEPQLHEVSPKIEIKKRKINKNVNIIATKKIDLKKKEELKKELISKMLQDEIIEDENKISILLKNKNEGDIINIEELAEEEEEEEEETKNSFMNKEIPNELKINNAKEIRERKRNEKDYIPLNEEDKEVLVKKPLKHEESLDTKLLKKDVLDEFESSQSESDEEIFDEHSGRVISFADSKDDKRRNMDKVKKYKIDDAWEEAQLKNSGVLKKAKKKNKNEEDMDLMDLDFEDDIKAEVIDDDDDDEEIQDINKLLEDFKYEIKNKENGIIKEKKNIELIREDIKKTKESENNEKLKFEKLNDEYLFFQEIRNYIISLITCIDAKIETIEMEEENVLKNRENFYTTKLNEWIDYQKSKSIEINEILFSNTISNLIKEGKDIRNNIIFNYESKFKLLKSSDDYDLGYDNVIEEFNKISDFEYVKVNNILDDVRTEYSSIDQIISHFKVWKEKFPKSYEETYCEYSLQKVFSPYIRLELNNWNPITDKSFDELSFFYSIMKYSEEMIPDLVKKIVLPIFIHSINYMFNPISEKNTIRFQSLFKDISIYLDETNSNSIKKCVVEKIKLIINEIVLTPSTNKFVVNKNMNERVYAFINNQFILSVYLLRNILSWKVILDIEDVEYLYFYFVNTKLSVFIKNHFDKKNLFEQIIQYLPNDWILKIKNIIF